MTVLVIGGAGYIGSHTCKALKQKGYLPVVYDNLQNGHRWAAAYGPLVVGDLLDASLLDQSFKAYQPEAVLPFASSLPLLQAMQKNQVLRLVFSSAAAVYGLPQEEQLKEMHRCDPINVYGN